MDPKRLHTKQFIFICLIFVAVVEMVHAATTRITYQHLIIPFLTCVGASVPILFASLFQNTYVNSSDILLLAYLLTSNSISIYILAFTAPYSLVISVYFQYILMRIVYDKFMKQHKIMQGLVQRIIALDSFSPSKTTSKWHIPHPDHRKCNDDCLICLEPLTDSQYVHVLMHVVDDIVSVKLSISNTLLQCSECSSVLHMQCTLQCNSKCPVCVMR
jgi:hypothetical protein